MGGIAQRTVGSGGAGAIRGRSVGSMSKSRRQARQKRKDPSRFVPHDGQNGESFTMGLRGIDVPAGGSRGRSISAPTLGAATASVAIGLT